MKEDDAAYHRSVRNAILVLGAMVLTVASALVVPPLVNPVHEQFNGSASVASPYGFTLNLKLNATQPTTTSGLTMTARLNNTSNQIGNITAANRWPLSPRGLWTRICTSGWPVGVGVMAGYYTTDNFSLGSLVPIPMPLLACPVSIYTPKFFLLQAHGSVAIVNVNGALVEWNLTTTLELSGSRLSPQRGGVYTAIAADEWGDVAVAHFRVTS